MIPIVVAFCFFLEGLDSTIVATAIPAMARGLDETPLRLGLALTVYVLAQAVFIPVSGWVADRFGMRRTFCAAMLIFALGSMASGLAPDFPSLIAARALQGFGGALMTPVGRLILFRSFARSDFARAISYMNIPSVIGPTMGPLLGGVITTYADWRLIFFVNVPFCLIGVVMAWRYVQDVDTPPPGKFDLPGFLLVGSGMLLLQLSLEELSHGWMPRWTAVPLLMAAAGALAWYAVHARSRPNAALDLTQFSVRTFRISLLAGGLTRIGMNMVPFLLPLMLQLALGLSPMESGSLTFMMSVGTLVSRTISVKLLRAWGFRTLLLINSTLCAVGIAGFVMIGPGVPHWAIVLYVLLFGAVRNMQFNNLQTMTYADINRAGLSRATSLGGGIQQLTMGLGVSSAATMLGAVAVNPEALAVGDFHLVFLMAAVFPLLGLPGFWSLKRDDGAQVSGHRTGGGETEGKG